LKQTLGIQPVNDLVFAEINNQRQKSVSICKTGLIE